MFVPVIWLVLSSFKTPAALVQFPPTLLPYAQETVRSRATMNRCRSSPSPWKTARRLSSPRSVASGWRRRWSIRTIPDEIVKVNIDDREPVDDDPPLLEQLHRAVGRFNFLTYLRNSVIVTVVATPITLIINSMAAFALSKYQFRGRDAILVIIIGTLMIPVSVMLGARLSGDHPGGLDQQPVGRDHPRRGHADRRLPVAPIYADDSRRVAGLGRIDGASEWRIYWQIVLPLSAPALAVLAIFSVMWRWNDFLWPLIVLSRSEFFTLQVGLNAFQGELNVQWHYVLAMTVLTLLPITVVFAFLQRFITTGIATTGMK